MGFWDRQVNDLMTGIGGLVAGGGAPLAPPSTPTPTPPPPPADLLPPAPPYDPGQSGPYPPWIPPSEVDTSHVPESAIAGVHGDDSVKPNEDVVLWPPPPSGVGDAAGTPGPGNLPPYWLKDHREIAPGIFVPDDRPEPPGQTHPAAMSNWTGKAADEVKAVEESLRQNRSAMHDTDRELGETIVETGQQADTANARLRQLQDEINAGAQSLQPTLDTPAGRAQMAAFLNAKAEEACAVIASAQQTATTHAATLAGMRARYDTIR